MRHAVFVKPGRVEWQSMREPTIKTPHEALVRPIVVGRCDLDVAFMRGLLPLAGGEPIGHEIIGEILEVGSEVDFKSGHRVFVSAQISCGTCAACVAGSTGRCLTVPFAASYGMGRPGGFGGGLADVVHVPFANTMLSALPEGMAPSGLIGLADMATDAWRGIGPQLVRQPRARVLVIGGMPSVIGLYAAGLARALGAVEVDYVDTDSARNLIARSYGVSLQTLQGVRAQCYEIVFVADPRRVALEIALRAVAPGGSITSAAPSLDGTPQFDTADLYHRGLTWTIGRPDCCAARRGLMEAWTGSDFDPGKVPITEVDWEDAPEAWNSDALYVVAVR